MGEVCVHELLQSHKLNGAWESEEILRCWDLCRMTSSNRFLVGTPRGRSRRDSGRTGTLSHNTSMATILGELSK